MNLPDWKTCTEEELWKFVAWNLEKHGIRSVLVGGAVVSIYTEGLYRSGDLDLVLEEADQMKLDTTLKKLGFQPSKSRYYKHPECRHLFLEFPRGPVEIGDEYPIVAEEIEVEGQVIRLLSPTDSVKDRLAGYIHWQSRANFDQALLICQRQPKRVNMKAVKKWCQNEGGIEAYIELEKKLHNK